MTRLLRCEEVTVLLEGLRKDQRFVLENKAHQNSEATIKSKKNRKPDKKHNCGPRCGLPTAHLMAKLLLLPPSPGWQCVSLPLLCQEPDLAALALLHGHSPCVIPLFCVNYHIGASRQRSPGHRSCLQRTLGTEYFSVPKVGWVFVSFFFPLPRLPVR